MDMYLNSQNFICTKIEQLIRKEFLSDNDTVVAVRYVDKDGAIIDQTMFRKYEAYYKLAKPIEMVGFDDAFRKLYREVRYNPAPQLISQSITIKRVSVMVTAMIIKLDCGYVFCYAGTRQSGFFEITACPFGLLLTLCELLKEHDRSASRLSRLLPSADLVYLNSDTRTAIAQLVQISIQKWNS